jgi:hypothetical protein
MPRRHQELVRNMTTRGSALTVVRNNLENDGEGVSPRRRRSRGHKKKEIRGIQGMPLVPDAHPSHISSSGWWVGGVVVWWCGGGW